MIGWAVQELNRRQARQKCLIAPYAPFGESYADSGSYDHFFTGQIPGVVSDDYDFLYREYNPKQGRWISPRILLGWQSPTLATRKAEIGTDTY